MIEIFDNKPSEWWEGRNNKGEVGFIPSNYVQLV